VKARELKLILNGNSASNQAMVKRRKRDVYGNWVWEDDEELLTDNEKKTLTATGRKGQSAPPVPNTEDKEREEISLDWKDIVALSIASLETFLLPLVVFILIIVGIVLGLALLH
jgi:hypothetical protein